MSVKKVQVEEIVIDGVTYVPKSNNRLADKIEGMQYVICRTYSAGVFAGFLKERNGQEVVLINARRIWYWNGAASLSQLATDGTDDPKNCKFPIAVKEVSLLQAIEIIPCTEKAKRSIDEVPIWKK